MSELPSSYENQEKIKPNQTLLLAEPIFKAPNIDEGKRTKFSVPVGAEDWVEELALNQPTDERVTESLSREYLSIVTSLKELDVPFRIIIAHRDSIDLRFTVAMIQHFGLRGLSLHQAISSTCFPRDMLVDFDGKTYVNPQANFNFPDNSGLISPLGEGGRVLKLDKKIFVPDPRGFVQTRRKYTRDLNGLPGRFQFGFLPFALAAEIDTSSKTKKIFPNDHLDRVAAFIKGKDEVGYLLLDRNYVDQSQFPYGQHWRCIKDACQKLTVTPIVIDRKPESIPYALNLEQFADGNVLLTGGDDNLTKSVQQLVGANKVHVTDKPVIYYPLYRNGGIRCMLLHAPQKVVGSPVITQA